jgi:serine/threonine protein kinase
MSSSRTDHKKPDTFMRQIRHDDSKYYTTHEELGKGSYGKVYRVQNRQNGQMMACKLQQVKGDYAEWATKRELEVWRKAARGSKYVVQVYDASYNVETREVRIYTELLEGGDLHRFLVNMYSGGGDEKKARRIHPLIVSHVAWQLACALADIQAASILHRDIKTDNVLMTMKVTPEMNMALWRLTEGKALDAAAEKHLLDHYATLARRDDRLCVLTDFGLSRDETAPERSAYTMAPTAKWTLGTSAPELLFYNYQSPMADVYSVGVLINMLCTGRSPPPAGTAFPRLPSCYDAELQNLVDECLSFDLEDRPTAGRMSSRLYALRLREGERINKLFGAQQQYKQYQEWMVRERERQHDVERRARERDQAAAPVWRQSITDWGDFQRKQKEQEAKQLPARPGAQYTKADRAAFLAQSKARMPPAAGAAAPVVDSVQEAEKEYLESKRRYEEKLRERQLRRQQQATAAAQQQPQQQRQRRGSTNAPPAAQPARAAAQPQQQPVIPQALRPAPAPPQQQPRRDPSVYVYEPPKPQQPQPQPQQPQPARQRKNSYVPPPAQPQPQPQPHHRAPAQPVQPMYVVQPQPARPVQPVQPVQPGQPMYVVQPVPAQPVPAQPVQRDTRRERRPSNAGRR